MEATPFRSISSWSRCFEADEQKALLHAAAFAREAGYPSEEPLNRAVSKIKRYTNPEQLERLERHESSIEAIHPPTASSLTRILHEIEAGIDRQSSLEIDYATGYDGITQPRILDPRTRPLEKQMVRGGPLPSAR